MTSNDSPNSNKVFSNVKSKLINFSPSYLFPNITFLKKKVKAHANELKPNMDNEHQATTTNHSDCDIPLSGVFYSDSESNVIPVIIAHPNVESSKTNEPTTFNDNYSTFNNSLKQNDAVDDIEQYQDVTWYEDTLERQHFRTLVNLKTLGKITIGNGHNFQVAQLNTPSFCDKCGDFIYGLYKQAVKCQNCRYTCHYKCQNLVQLDCRSFIDTTTTSFSCNNNNNNNNDNINNDNNNNNININNPTTDLLIADDDSTEINLNENLCIDSSNLKTIEQQQQQHVDALPYDYQLAALINKYNETVDGLKLTLDQDGQTFRGFIQILMNFTRPISVVAGDRPSSIYDVLNCDDDTSKRQQQNDVKIDKKNNNEKFDQNQKTITSFFLPRNSTKIIHIDSRTTTRQLITALLGKFKVADNPLKFALYERDTQRGQTLKARLKKLSDDVCPLRLALAWSNDCNKRFVLQENDTGDILYHYFEIPELETFLKLLEKEEIQYVTQIKRKYDAYRFYLKLELQQRGMPINYDANDPFSIDEIPGFIRRQLSH